MDEGKLLKKKKFLIKKNNKAQLAVICNDLAALYYREGKYESSIHEYMYEARVYDELGNRLQYARSNRMIGEIYLTLAEFDKALKHEIIYLNIAKEENNELDEQRAMASIGRTYLIKAISDPDKLDTETLNLANNAFLKSLELCEGLKGISKLEQMDMRARLLLNIGIVQENKCNYADGIEYMLKSIQICKKHDIFEQLHQGHSSLGMLFCKRQDYRKALSHLDCALEAAGRISDKVPPLCSALVAKSEVLFHLLDFQGAKHVLLKAYKLKSPNQQERNAIEHNLKVVAAMCNAEDAVLTTSFSDHETKKKLYEKLGDGACDLKIYSQAIEYYKKMLECAISSGETGQTLVAAYVSLAQTYKDNKQYDLAIEYFRKEYEISRDNPTESCNTLLNIAQTLELAKKSFTETAKVYEEARNLAVATGNMRLEGKVLVLLINLMRKFKKVTDAKALERKLIMMDYVPSESESEEDVSGTPDIGGDIDIDNISDESDDDSAEQAPATDAPKLWNYDKILTVKKNNKGETQLHTACIQGNTVVVRKFLAQGHPVNIRDNCGWLPLHEACNYGYLEIAELLLDHGTNINDRGGTLCGGVTPLHDAATNGHLEVIEMMLNRGASAIAKTDDGETPLDMLKLWRKKINLDPIALTFYESIVHKMSLMLEKAGIPTTQVQNETIYERDESKPRRSPRQKSPSKFTRNLRHSLDLQHDFNPIPSCSGVQISATYDKSDSESDSSTCKQYQNVMDNLRNRSTNVKNMLSPKKSPKNALVPDENWLENDLPQNNPSKKRKTASIAKQTFLTTTGIRRSNSFASSISSNSVHSIHSDSDLFNSPNVSCEPDLDDSSDSTLSRKRKSQSSLLESGFSRKRSDLSISPNMAAVSLVNKCGGASYKRQQKISRFGSFRDDFEADSTTTLIIDNSQVFNASLSSSITRSLLAVNVRIDNKLFRIPVPVNDIAILTIGWLGNEASKRYYRQEGILPALQLETGDSAILGNDDPLSMVFLNPGQPDEVKSTVLSWNLPPLPERYLESCSTYKIEVNSKLRELLDECQGTLNLKLDDFALEKSQQIPLFRSLNRQNNLQHINLSGNTLLNDGVQLLCSVLPSLSQLRSLNLSLNNITSEGVRYISNLFQNTTKPILEFLTDLNLSFNLIGDDSLPYLTTILRHVKLRSLTLCGCNLSDNLFENTYNRNVNLNFEFLESFDISYNELNNDGIIMFISFLNFDLVKSLNFSHNLAIRESGIVKELAVNIQQCEQTNIKCLELARCHVNDSEIWDLLRFLSRAHSLETLNLSYNNDLTSVSLRRLIQHRPSFKNIILEGCTNIIQYLDQCNMNIVTNTTDIYPTNSLKSLQISLDYVRHSKEADILTSMWEREWGRKAKIEKLFGEFMHLTVND